MINYISVENKGEKGVLKIDPRTKIILMILGNVAIFLAFSIQIKISLIIFLFDFWFFMWCI